MRRIVVVIVLLIAACAPSETAVPPSPKGIPQTSVADRAGTVTPTTIVAETRESTQPEPFTLSSPAFENGSIIPTEFTCDGANVSPPLRVDGLPPDAESVVVVVDEPGATLGTWDHWVRYDIHVEPDGLVLPRAATRSGKAGINSWKVTEYMGPCPPDGEEHSYVFTVYALSDVLDLPEGVGSSVVYEEMQPLLISSAELTGRYSG